MPLKKCCVGGCNATSDTHKLYCLPKNDNLRSLWLSFLVPTNILLGGLSKDQLLSKRVCERHFDEHQFDAEGKRLRYSYPTLFTDEEIALGEPRPSVEAGRYGNDHTYYKESADEEDVDDSSLVIGRAGEQFHEHPLCSTSSSSSVAKSLRGEQFHELPSCSTSAIYATKSLKDEELEHPKCSIINEVVMDSTEDLGVDSDHPKSSVITEMEVPPSDYLDEDLEHPQSFILSETDIHSTEDLQTDCKMKPKSTKKQFIKKVKKISSQSLGLPAMERLNQAATYGNSEELFKNFNLLSKQAQTFVMMQLKQCRKNKMARRFTVEEKLVALAIMKQSPKCYKLLENMFALPSKRTLNRLSERVSIDSGLNPQVFQFIQEKIKNWEIKQKLCTIVFDEISLTPHLSYNEKSDEIHGFVDVAGDRKMRFSDHALVFMIRGVCASWRQTIAYYFCEGTISAASLQKILKEIVPQVAKTGLIPLGLICDQGSTFRTAIRTMREDTIKMRNLQKQNDDGTINISGHDLSVFFDPPHLLKSVRNNFVDKDIIWKKKKASWKDIQFIYDLDNKLGHTRTLPKLTANHVNPDKIKKMKVSVAAQIFSARTAAMLNYTNALNHYYTGETSSMETTAEVVEFFDKLFDSVNCNPGGATKGKLLKKAVKPNSPHIEFWTEAIKLIKDIKYEDSTSKLAVQSGRSRYVRVPCLDGWITSLESFIRISKLLFNKYAIKYYYPRMLNQDPLENFFGRVRALNYRNINPNAVTFIYAYKSLLISNFLSPQSKFSNCESDNGDNIIDPTILFKSFDNENKENIILDENSKTQKRKRDVSLSASGSVTMDEVVLEKIKVQSSAYTAGYLCRKLTKNIKCGKCSQTYTSKPSEDINTYIRHREYKMLKNHNLAYPNSKMLMLYRDASSIIHNYLNEKCHYKNIGGTLKLKLIKLKTSWLGCNETHSNSLTKCFLKTIVRLHVHHWCNTINKILKGAMEEKYCNMSEIHSIALRKYKSYRLRKKTINK